MKYVWSIPQAILFAISKYITTDNHRIAHFVSKKSIECSHKQNREKTNYDNQKHNNERFFHYLADFALFLFHKIKGVKKLFNYE